jgi:uncharacterized protein
MKVEGCQSALIVVAKRPSAGQTKTRLTPPLSPDTAAQLYECFLLDTLALVGRVAGLRPVIAYWPAGARSYFAGVAPGFDLLLQQGNDLGERLDNALNHYLKLGYERAVIMNSDGPNLPLAFLEEAFHRLNDRADVVLGPCEDGGYYLIGLKRPAPRLLREVPMSTPRVVEETLALAAAENLTVARLPCWYDVDELADLRRLAADLAGASPWVCACTRAFLAANYHLL